MCGGGSVGDRRLLVRGVFEVVSLCLFFRQQGYAQLLNGDGRSYRWAGSFVCAVGWIMPRVWRACVHCVQQWSRFYTCFDSMTPCLFGIVSCFFCFGCFSSLAVAQQAVDRIMLSGSTFPVADGMYVQLVV
jgi:hypothetical protein